MLQDYLDQVLDVFSDGVCVTDAGGKVLYVNAMHGKITGIPRESMIDRDVLEFTGRGVFDTVINPEVLRTGKPLTKVQTLSSGRRLVLEGHPIFDRAGRVVFCVTILRDESRLEEMRGKIEFQKELLDVFTKLSSAARMQDADMPEIVQSGSMAALRSKISMLAKTDAPVLLLGETGVGKDVLAKRIHRESDRKNCPFIKVDCGSISPGLIETELFGYVGGTFSGANRNGKVGLIEAADSGTVYLDEIGELPLAMQTRLLRFLQDGEVLRVGATHPKRLDVRIIAATNKDLESAIRSGEFRSDLYYRLRIAVLEIPPLRERRDDILPMAHFFQDFYNHKYGRKMSFSADAEKAMQAHAWPGNVRELRNMIQGLAVTCTDDVILPEHLPFAAAESRHEDPQGDMVPGIVFDGRTWKDIMRDMESAVLHAAMRRFGSIPNIARELKIDRSTVFRKVRDLEQRGEKFS
ncbi:MAG: sigma 54-interacting transcriptional regulator [Mailhella sp.]|nr:sigma 54-interacting transcriptional regulator [Mailhella sp.]